MARVPAKKTTARKAAPAKKTTARRKAAPARRAAARRAPAAAPTASRAAAAAPPAGSLDLAGGLRNLLGSVETEVRAVSALSERIDEMVAALNDARDEQAKRLLVLDALRESVQDTNLGQFLDKAIRPRRARVPEVMPDRLTRE
jgi:hypothetical protein